MIAGFFRGKDYEICGSKSTKNVLTDILSLVVILITFNFECD